MASSWFRIPGASAWSSASMLAKLSCVSSS